MHQSPPIPPIELSRYLQHISDDNIIPKHMPQSPNMHHINLSIPLLTPPMNLPLITKNSITYDT